MRRETGADAGIEIKFQQPERLKEMRLVAEHIYEFLGVFQQPERLKEMRPGLRALTAWPSTGFNSLNG